MPPQTFKVNLSKTTQKQLRKIDRRYLKKTYQIFQRLETNPSISGDIQKIKGEANTYRYRLGDYRIIYEINFPSHSIFILGIFPRGQAYK